MGILKTIGYSLSMFLTFFLKNINNNKVHIVTKVEHF